MVRIRRYLATSDQTTARVARGAYRYVRSLSLPAPKVIAKPMLWSLLAVRSLYYSVMRVFVCEPLLKAYCTQYGRDLRTGAFIHWVQGKGDIIVGDNVTIDGKCGIVFAARFAATPTLSIGNNTYIGHNTSFSIGKRITIGDHCLIAGGVAMLDSNGHPVDPDKRRAGEPPDESSVRPIMIGDNVWIGQRALICPGVTIGDNSVVSAVSLVRDDVPPDCIVAGNPAKVVKRLITGRGGKTDAESE